MSYSKNSYIHDPEKDLDRPKNAQFQESQTLSSKYHICLPVIAYLIEIDIIFYWLNLHLGSTKSHISTKKYLTRTCLDMPDSWKAFSKLPLFLHHVVLILVDFCDSFIFDRSFYFILQNLIMLFLLFIGKENLWCL